MTSKLTLANWNLERVLPTQDRVTAIREYLKQRDADIWVLTETHELVGPGPGFSSVMSGERDGDAKPGEYWAAIWSRHPMMNLPSFVSDPTRCAAAHITHPDMGEIVVYATVLPWGGSSWRGVEAANGAAFEAALGAYVSDWLRLRATFPDALCVVAGDFNQDLAPYHYYGSKHQRGLLKKGLAAAGLTALTQDANDPESSDVAHRHACIDHICVSELRGIQGYEIVRWPDGGKPDPRLSDHFGVAVELVRD